MMEDKMYTEHEINIATFASDEQFVSAITPGSVIDGDYEEAYSLKPNRSDS